MKRSNLFLANTLRTLSCIATVTACSAWANVITVQSTTTTALAPRDLPSSAYTSSARGIEAATVTDTSTQVLFQSTPSVTVAEASTAPASAPALNSAIESASAQPQVSASSAAPDAAFSVASSTTQAPPAGGAIAAAFDEDFVSVPTVQFATVSAGPNVQAPSSASVTAVPEMSAFFPIVGLIAAVSCTQILRRRRMAQKTAPIA
jgi:hypothetical protein